MRSRKGRVYYLSIVLDLSDIIADVEPIDLFDPEEKYIRLSDEFKEAIWNVVSGSMKDIGFDKDDTIHVKILNLHEITHDLMKYNWKGLLARGATKKDYSEILLGQRIFECVNRYVGTSL